MSPSGNEATSFNSPPSALTYSRSVLTYMSSRRSSFETAACSTLMALATSTCVTFRALRSSWSCISTSMASARAAARACACGDILARNSLNFLAIDLPFLSQCLDVHVVQPVGYRHMHFVPPVIAGLVAAEQENGAAARVERIKNPVRPAFVLHTKLAHVGVPRPFDPRGVREPEIRPLLFEQPNRCIDGLLFRLGQIGPPLAKLVGVLHFPFAWHYSS